MSQKKYYELHEFYETCEKRNNTCHSQAFQKKKKRWEEFLIHSMRSAYKARKRCQQNKKNRPFIPLMSSTNCPEVEFSSTSQPRINLSLNFKVGLINRAKSVSFARSTECRIKITSQWRRKAFDKSWRLLWLKIRQCKKGKKTLIYKYYVKNPQ